jgi:hypothetical protein
MGDDGPAASMIADEDRQWHDSQQHDDREQ